MADLSMYEMNEGGSACLVCLPRIRRVVGAFMGGGIMVIIASSINKLFLLGIQGSIAYSIRKASGLGNAE